MRKACDRQQPQVFPPHTHTPHTPEKKVIWKWHFGQSCWLWGKGSGKQEVPFRQEPDISGSSSVTGPLDGRGPGSAGHWLSQWTLFCIAECAQGFDNWVLRLVLGASAL